MEIYFDFQKFFSHLYVYIAKFIFVKVAKKKLQPISRNTIAGSSSVSVSEQHTSLAKLSCRSVWQFASTRVSDVATARDRVTVWRH